MSDGLAPGGSIGGSSNRLQVRGDFRTRPFLSVVVPVGRVDDALSCCVRALALQALPSDLFELILVLDGVKLPCSLLDDIGVRASIHTLSPARRSSRSAARNCGLAHAKGQAVVSLDCDMVPSPAFLSEHYSAQQHTPSACIGARRFAFPFQGMNAKSESAIGEIFAACYARTDFRESFYTATNYLADAGEPFWAFSTCNCSYPLDVARQIGAFDEDLRGWGLEDIEFAYRLWKLGGVEFRYLGSAVAVHIEHDRDRMLEMEQWAKNRQHCIAKHGDLFADPAARRVAPLLIDRKARQ